ncbi:DapH/DapD/GlmU-related protein [Vibrio alginolyticus]
MLTKIFMYAISFLPINSFKVFLYRKIFKLKIGDNVRIGFGSILTSKRLYISDDVKVGRFCVIGGGGVKIGENTLIKNRVSAYGPGDFNLGNNVVVNNNTHFDLSSNVCVGDNVVFGGRGSEVWTHGYDWKRNKVSASITIEKDVYLGSSVILNPGVTICSRTVVCAGSVIYKSITEQNRLVSTHSQYENAYVPLDERSNKYNDEFGEKVFRK